MARKNRRMKRFTPEEQQIVDRMVMLAGSLSQHKSISQDEFYEVLKVLQLALIWTKGLTKNEVRQLLSQAEETWAEGRASWAS